MTNALQGEKRMVKLNYRKGVMIMVQVMINFRMDEELKKSMEETCKDLGLEEEKSY